MEDLERNAAIDIYVAPTDEVSAESSVDATEPRGALDALYKAGQDALHTAGEFAVVSGYVAATAGLAAYMAKYGRKEAERMRTEIANKLNRGEITAEDASEAIGEITANTAKDTPPGHDIGQRPSGKGEGESK